MFCFAAAGKNFDKQDPNASAFLDTAQELPLGLQDWQWFLLDKWHTHSVSILDMSVNQTTDDAEADPVHESAATRSENSPTTEKSAASNSSSTAVNTADTDDVSTVASSTIPQRYQCKVFRNSTLSAVCKEASEFKL